MASIIDIHPHVICPDTTRYPLAPLGGTQCTWSRDRPTSFETMIKEMDAAGVARSAIVQASTAYGHDNSYVAEAIAAYPKRFTGVFSVDVLAPDAVDKMKHWIGRGFSGMRLFTTGSTMPGQATWFADPSTYPAWEYAGEAGIPVCMQMTPQGFPAAARPDGPLPEGAHHPRPPGAAAAGRRPAVRGRPAVLRSRQIRPGVSEGDAGQRRAEGRGARRRRRRSSAPW